jgi:hypothetical protein
MASLRWKYIPEYIARRELGKPQTRPVAALAVAEAPLAVQVVNIGYPATAARSVGAEPVKRCGRQATTTAATHGTKWPNTCESGLWHAWKLVGAAGLEPATR